VATLHAVAYHHPPTGHRISHALVIGLAACGPAPSSAPGDATTTTTDAPITSSGTTDSDESGSTTAPEADDLAQLEQLRGRDCVTADDPRILRLASAIAAERLTIDDESFAACMSSDDPVYFDLGNAYFGATATDPLPCDALWIGQTPPGAACDVGHECVSGHFCRRDDESRSQREGIIGACGECVAQGDVGAPCHLSPALGTLEDCLRPLACIDGICSVLETKGDLGDPCGSSSDCGYGSCEECPGGGALECVDHECTQATYRQLGEVCMHPGQCDLRLTCEIPEGALESTCTAATAGGPCQGPANCPEHQTCSEGTLLNPAHCLPRLERGDACEDNAQCPAEHTCFSGVCGQRLGPGEACGWPDTCVVGTGWVEGICQCDPLVGEACEDSCARGSCIDGECEAVEVGAPCDTWSADVCGAPENACDGQTCVATAAEGEPCSEPMRRGFYCDAVSVTTAICIVQ
jgi:hypothetical protein